MNTTHNKNGQVSAYGLACGYQQVYIQEVGKVEMYLESRAYHVRLVLSGWEDALWNDREGSGKQWQSFEKLSHARKCFVEYCIIVNDLRGKVKGFPWLTAFALNPS